MPSRMFFRVFAEPEPDFSAVEGDRRLWNQGEEQSVSRYISYILEKPDEGNEKSLRSMAV